MSIEPPFAQEHVDTRIESLGACTIDSPLTHGRFVSDDDRVSYDLDARRIETRLRAEEPLTSFEEAGPRREPARCRGGSHCQNQGTTENEQVGCHTPLFSERILQLCD